MSRTFSHALPLTLGLLFTINAGSLTADDTRVYIPMGSDDHIVIVDPTTDSIRGRIDGVSGAHGLAATPDGLFLIAGSFDEIPLDSVGEASPDSDEAIDHDAHHSSPDAEEEVDENVFSVVSILEVGPPSVRRTITVPGAVHHTAVSGDGRFAVATHPNGDRISVIDLEGSRIHAIIETGSRPNFASIANDNMTVFVTNSGDDTVSVVDLALGAVVGAINVGSSPEHAVLSKNGQRLYVVNAADGSVSVIDTNSLSVVETIDVGESPHGIDLSGDGTRLFIAIQGEGLIVEVDLLEGAKRSIPLGPAPYHLAVIPTDGELYISSAAEPKLWVLDGTSLEVVGTIQIGGKGHQFAVIQP